jgi:GntR family transcriptional regulator
LPKDTVTAQEIQQSIMNRILRGHYAVGDRLPSVRELAHELGANRNTVNKAYQMLADLGVIESGSSTRTGFFVKSISHIDRHTQSDFSDYFYQQSLQLAWQGMAGGMGVEEVLEQLVSAVQQVYAIGRPRITFYECNELDSREMGTHLGEILNLDIHCGLLEDLRSDNVNTVIETYDLIVTTFHHLAEVTHHIGENHSDKIVAIDTRLTPDTLLNIARLPGQRNGVICSVPHTTHMLKHILHSYYPDHQMEAVVIDHTQAVLRLAQSSDHLIVTHTCIDQVRLLTGRDADVVVNFMVDEQSIQYLKRRVYDIQARKTEALRGGIC